MVAVKRGEQLGWPARWLRLQRAHLARNPMCQNCGRLANCAHVLDPAEGSLVSLCETCAERRTLEILRAEWGD